MLRDLNYLFSELNATHFICYGTLWGAIRYSKLLPFDRDVDLCVLYDDEVIYMFALRFISVLFVYICAAREIVLAAT